MALGVSVGPLIRSLRGVLVNVSKKDSKPCKISAGAVGDAGELKALAATDCLSNMEVTFLLHGFQLPLRISPDQTIAEVKAAFEKSHGLAASENRLYKGGSVLVNSKQVKDYDIIGGATLHVIPAAKTDGGSPEPEQKSDGSSKRNSTGYVGAARRTGNTWSSKGGGSPDEAQAKKRVSLPGQSLAAAAAAAAVAADDGTTTDGASNGEQSDLRESLAAAVAAAEGTAAIDHPSASKALASVKQEIVNQLPIGFGEEMSLGEETADEIDEWERRQDEQERLLQEEMDDILRQQEKEEQAVAAEVTENLLGTHDGVAAPFSESKDESGDDPAEWIQLEDMTYFCPRTRKGEHWQSFFQHTLHSPVFNFCFLFSLRTLAQRSRIGMHASGICRHSGTRWTPRS
jgi:hypothetical protein